METTQTETKSEMTYEEAIEKLKGFGFHTHEVRISSTRYGNRTLKCFSEDDARSLAHLLVQAARELHGEVWIENRYGEDSLEELLTWEEFHETDNWKVEVWHVTPRAQWNPEAVNMNAAEFVFGHRRGAYLMARPDSKVFVYTGGRDCDGYRWGSVSEFKTLLEAHEHVEESYRWADGPMGWSVITRDDFEHFNGVD